MKNSLLLTNPLLLREIRARFRDGRAFGLLFALVTGLSLLFVSLYGGAVTGSGTGAPGALTGRAIFTQISWMQTLGWLLVSPALTSSSIAYERERGWFDGLLLCPLSARAIALGKWLSALLFAAILTLVTLPFQALLLLLLGGVSTRQFALVTLLQAACAMCGAAIGLATSAWSLRANSALRTAYGGILIALIASFYGAATAGELPFRFPAVALLGAGNAFWTFLGRTNPILRALEISGELEFQRLAICFGFLMAITLLFLAIAVYYAQRPLEEAPFITRRAKTPKQTVTTENATTENPAETQTRRDTHGEIPLLSKMRFANPVFDREVRAKFRLRQPPLAVLVVEAMLALAVAFFYVRTFLWALFEPQYRELIWWGLFFTGLIMTIMASGVMGSNGLAREREGGTWEGVRLSLLTPGEILRGKYGASLFTCALFSLPVWPLMLPCVVWNADDGARNLITRGDVSACLLVWLATASSCTLIGLWTGRRAARTSRASGQTLGVIALFTLLWPWLVSRIMPDSSRLILGATHPFVAISNALSQRLSLDSSLAPFVAVQIGFAVVMGLALHRFLTRELRSAAGAEELARD